MIYLIRIVLFFIAQAIMFKKPPQIIYLKLTYPIKTFKKELSKNKNF